MKKYYLLLLFMVVLLAGCAKEAGSKAMDISGTYTGTMTMATVTAVHDMIGEDKDGKSLYGDTYQAEEDNSWEGTSVPATCRIEDNNGEISVTFFDEEDKAAETMQVPYDVDQGKFVSVLPDDGRVIRFEFSESNGKITAKGTITDTDPQTGLKNEITLALKKSPTP